MFERAEYFWIVYGGYVLTIALIAAVVFFTHHLSIPEPVAIPEPENRPKPEITHYVQCLNCGSQFRSTRAGDVRRCPNCPSTLCPYGQNLVLQIAGVVGPSEPNPSDPRYEKYQSLLKQLEDHAARCRGCREELNAKR